MRFATALIVGLTLTFVNAATADPIDEGFRAYDRADYATALKLWSPLAERGNVKAQFYLGMFYHHSTGGRRNYTKARQWYQKAANQGHAKAQVNLGGMYDEGLGIPQNYALAAEWYRKAAEQGNVQGQYNLGLMHFYGTGVSRDYAKAAKLFRMAAAQGYRNAQFNLGLMHFRGQGVNKDYNKAHEWYRQAAEAGDADAHYNLGVMYFNGYGVFKNNIRAYMFFTLSAAFSTDIPVLKRAMQSREIVALNLSKLQILEAQRLADDWWSNMKKKHPSTLGPQSRLPNGMIPFATIQKTDHPIAILGYRKSRRLYQVQSRE